MLIKSEIKKDKEQLDQNQNYKFRTAKPTNHKKKRRKKKRKERE